MSTYSFASFVLTITGPGGAISLGSGAGDAKEGVTFAFNADANSQTIGADGTPMNTMSQDKSGTVTVRLIKTSPTNGKLAAMMNFQRVTPGNWGQNVMAGGDIARGDQYSCQQVAFTKIPDNTYAAEGGTLDWVFHVGIMDASLSVSPQ